MKFCRSTLPSMFLESQSERLQMNNKRLAQIKDRAENYVPASFEEDGRLIQQFREDIDDLVGEIEWLRAQIQNAIVAHKNENISPILGHVHKTKVSDILFAILAQTDDEDEANARLIAAAPDLLEAAELGMRHANMARVNTSSLKARKTYEEDRKFIEAAIAKAKGDK